VTYALILVHLDSVHPLPICRYPIPAILRLHTIRLSIMALTNRLLITASYTLIFSFDAVSSFNARVSVHPHGVSITCILLLLTLVISHINSYLPNP
jgi:hypothetical protein